MTERPVERSVERPPERPPEQHAEPPAEQPFAESTIAELQQIVARYPEPRSALLPMLHLVQSVAGRITTAGIETCARMLAISPAEVAGVATFYTMYKRRPVGEYHVGVCTNTLCAVMGGDLIFERLKDHLGIGNDETTDDGAITLEHIECNAGCDYAPVLTVNWDFFDNMTPATATQLVDDLRAGAEVRSTRGPRICSWRETERVLAGFPDDRADEGPAGGPATLAGLRIARENQWRAPSLSSGDSDSTGIPGEQVSADYGRQSGRADSADELHASPVEVKTDKPKGQQE